MSSIDANFISELKSKINIVDVIGRYCSLKRNGPQNYWACCPLPGHIEKTPSFCVNEPGQFYHCFGCHKSGDVIKFIQEIENLTFYEAVTRLAEMYKIPVPVGDDYDEKEALKKKNERERLHAVLKETAHFYVKNLRTEQGKPYTQYLFSRGFDAKTITSFGMGASLDYNSLPNHLKSLGFTEKEMIDAGVCQRSKKGQVIDFQFQRLIVPIINNSNKVVAFGGRVIEKNPSFAKYKNTSDTQIFNKRRVIFNVNKLHKLVKEEKVDYVIMVEGYMDVIALWQAGIKNVVASMGTQLTVEQARLLKRYVNKVVVSYDGDLAGQSATVRSLDIFADEGFEIKVLKLPNKMDPDEVVKEKGVDYYLELVEQAMPLIDYKLHVLKEGKNLKDVSDKRKFISQALDLIRTVKDTFMQEELLKKLRDLTDISYQSLKQDLDKGTVTVSTSTSIEVEINQQYSDNSAISKTERLVLSAFVYKKPYAVYDDDIYFNNAVREKIYNHIIFNENFKIENLFSLVGEDGAEELSAILSSGDTVFDKPIEEKYYLGCVTTLKKHNITNEIKKLNNEYQKEIDLTKKSEIGNMIDKLTKKLISL